MANQYTYSVPFTEEELYDCYVNKRMTQQEIAEKYGTTQKVVWRAMKKMGIPSRVAAKRKQQGPLNSNWKGGRVLQAKSKRARGEKSIFGNGYYYVLMPDHPNATKSGYVAEHILIATRQAGRPLKDGEVVHHINLNKHDNRPENLIITTTREHAIWHAQLAELAAELLASGAIIFDPNSGYRWRE